MKVRSAATFGTDIRAEALITPTRSATSVHMGSCSPTSASRVPGLVHVGGCAPDSIKDLNKCFLYCRVFSVIRVIRFIILGVTLETNTYNTDPGKMPLNFHF